MNNIPDTPASLLSPVWTHLTPIVAQRAEGATLYDQDGTPYLDFTCGIAITDHCHPKVRGNTNGNQ